MCDDVYTNHHHHGITGCIVNHSCSSPYNPCASRNTLKDYYMLENMNDPGNVSLRQNLDSRPVRIENNSRKDVLVTFSVHCSVHDPPQPKFLLRSGESRTVSINLPGEPMQYIWLFDPRTKQVINKPHPARYYMNLYVLLEGQNGWWIHDYHQPGFNAQK